MLDKIKTFLDKWGRVFLDVAMATVTYIALYKEGIFSKLDMWSWLVYFILIGAFIKTDFKNKVRIFKLHKNPKIIITSKIP